ncbi:hypothetical protein PVAG01_06007 [Phlyctema vagabunda]|uniref:ATP-grasp domain-containing protein n=1 Tax=Phlyctema vagabunda TaxID=108571 RepID=A0ABR4PFT2_9HELO
MPLSSTSPAYLHIAQNLSLVFLSILLIPLCGIIAIVSYVSSNFTSPKSPHQSAKSCARVLVTGVGMSKGLFLARAFYLDGNFVVGADFEPYMVPVSGRFSRSLARFYRLSRPSSSTEAASKQYTAQLIEIIRTERIELWVSCSGVATALEDGIAADAVERETNCKVVQFSKDLTETLHDKYTFIENTQRVGLNVPETHLVASQEEALSKLHQDHSDKESSKRFILKPVGMDDSSRADMTLLPLGSLLKTRTHLERFRLAPSRPFVLQQYVAGLEYCTHALVLDGRVRAFVACPSADMLMHYETLPAQGVLSKAMARYTQEYVESMSDQVTGHFSLDFIVDSGYSPGAAASEEQQIEGLLKNIYPIECNPRAHTAVVLFGSKSRQLSQIYLSLLPSSASRDSGPSTLQPEDTSGSGVYWLGHDVVTRVSLPLLSLASGHISPKAFYSNINEFVTHLLYWRDGTFEVWDPWPAFWLYVLYWPAMFLLSVIKGSWWSKCNVSTGKMFGC